MAITAAVYPDAEPSKKLGVKYLDDVQLTNTFPDWRALLGRIEEQRQIAKEAERAPKDSWDPSEGHFPQMYDNLYAILGGRGAGKSSVVLTLRNKMMNSRHHDILLPIITPEVISERECSILGWIMSATESVVAELEERIQLLEPGPVETCGSARGCLDGFFKDCQFQKENPLRRGYRDLFKKSIQTAHGTIDTSGYSAEDAVSYKAEQSRRQYKLIQDINRFWSQLTTCWYQINCLDFNKTARNDGSQEETTLKYPLIVLIFDDIDLVPERSMELLTTTFQYFTNTNIVILLTAAEKVLQDVIRLKMYERMLGSDSNSLLLDVFQGRPVNAMEHSSTVQFSSVERMASEFYDKVIPPSSRYRLRRYETVQEKLLYSYSSMQQSFAAPQGVVSIPLDQFLMEQVDKLRKAFAKKGGASDNFLCGGRDGKVFRKAYLTIFGSKNRNIANGCLEILNTCMRLEKLAKRMTQPRLNEEERKEVLQALRHLTQALMVSTPQLNEYAEQVSAFLQIDPDRQQITINYKAAWHCYKKERQAISDWVDEQSVDLTSRAIGRSRLFRVEEMRIADAQKKTAALIVLLFFIEGMLLTVDASGKQLHGYRVLYQLLNADVSRSDKGLQRQPLFPQQQKVEDFLDHYPLVLEHINRYVGVDLYSRQFAWEYLEDTFRTRAEQENTSLQDILEEELKTNRDWVRTVLSMLAVYYSGITWVKSEFIQMPNDTLSRLELFSFTSPLATAWQAEAEKFLAQNDLRRESKRLMKEFKNLMETECTWKEISAALKTTLFKTAKTASLQQWEESYEIYAVNNPNFQKWVQSYTALCWDDFVQAGMGEEKETISLTSLERCNELVRFVENTLKECLRFIYTKTDLYLSAEQFEEIGNCLRRLDDVSEEMRQKKNELVRALKLASSYPSVAERSVAAETKDLASAGREQDGRKETNEVEQGETEEVWCVKANPLLEYLVVLGAAVEEQARESVYSYYEQPDLSGYYTLVKYLAIGFYQTENIISEIGNQPFPLPGRVILDLKMLEELLPYYFAAKMGIALNENEEPSLEFDLIESEQVVLETKLRNLFDSVTQSAGKNPLKAVMRKVQEELAVDYYKALEARNE